MKVLDLFCGLKGLSKAFSDRGHEVISIDISSKFMPTLCWDVMGLSPDHIEHYGPFDVILASPPCEEFSKASMPDSWNKNRIVNPDTKLLEKTVELIRYLKPKYWVIENVRGAVPFFEPIIGKPVRHVGSRYLWGNFPMFDTAPKYGKWKLSPSPDRPAKRALIPYSLSMALCLSCELFTVGGK